MVTAPVRREVVREMVARGLSERRALAVGRMSASAFRYVPRPDGNAVVRDRIVDLAQRHRRDGAGMIYLKLRQAGHVINHKRVDRLYTEARLQLKRRRRKKIPRADRQPLVRPERRNQVWSADFVFDRTADGRVMKCLTIVDDATHEAVAIVPARAFGGLPVTRALDRLAITRGLPQISHASASTGSQFCFSNAMLTWSAHAGADPERSRSEPDQAELDERLHRVASTGCFRDDMPERTLVYDPCAHAQALIEAWRCEYNEERPKKGLGGLTPASSTRSNWPRKAVQSPRFGLVKADQLTQGFERH